MQTFLTYLHEKFLKGFKGDYSYVEVWQNPTAIELSQVAKKPTDTLYMPSRLSAETIFDQYGKKVYYLGGLLDKNLYVFDRDKAQHNDVASELPDLTPNWIPLYIYYYAATDAAAIDVSSFSLDYKRQHKIPEIIQRVAKHPKMKVFKTILGPDGVKIR